MKKPKATNEDDIEIGPASACSRSLTRGATEADMDKHDIEKEITFAVILLQEDAACAVALVGRPMEEASGISLMRRHSDHLDRVPFSCSGSAH